MSRYVKKKHGLVIGSDNWFFYRDKDGEMHDFPCILTVDQYYFDNSQAYFFRIETPAERILTHKRRLKPSEKTDEFGRDMAGRIITEPSKWAVKWLDENAPGWGYPPLSEKVNFCFFFQKRKHALALCNEVANILDGMRIGLR